MALLQADSTPVSANGQRKLKQDTPTAPTGSSLRQTDIRNMFSIAAHKRDLNHDSVDDNEKFSGGKYLSPSSSSASPDDASLRLIGAGSLQMGNADFGQTQHHFC